jgi:hypothetical protein
VKVGPEQVGPEKVARDICNCKSPRPFGRRVLDNNTTLTFLLYTRSKSYLLLRRGLYSDTRFLDLTFY